MGELLRARVDARDRIHRTRAAEKARELERLRELPRGPRLHRWQLQNARTHVVEADLDDVVPDGWYLAHRAEFDQLSRRYELPGRALAILVILAPVHGLKANDYGTGCAVQASASWWARKLACTERHVHRLFNELDPSAAWRRGEMKRRRRRRGETKAQHEQRMRESKPAARPGGRHLVHHFQQLRRYERVAGNGFRWWLDEAGHARSFVDTLPVTYLSPAGARVVATVGWTRARIVVKGHAPARRTVRCGALQALLRGWARKDATIRRRVAAVATHVTPNNVRPAEFFYTGGGDRGPSAPSWPADGRSGPGPPAGSAFSGDWERTHGSDMHGPEALHAHGAGQGKPPTLAELVARALAVTGPGRRTR